ncbi:sigma-70 family RNA polymerase sigma factor [bacterium]|nr:sigma-70 family RNA polymerase sigma factor [bacterium]
MNDDQHDDEFIVKEVLAGEIQEFGTLVSKYEALMYRYLLPQLRDLQEVEDISQETFFRAFRYLGSFDPKRKFSTWLLKIARNLVVNRYQKNSFRTEKIGYVDGFVENSSKTVSSNDPGNQLQTKEEFRNIFSDMLGLSEDLRIPLFLRVLQEMSYEEIGESLDVPVQTVKNRIFKARKILREKRDSTDGLR